MQSATATKDNNNNKTKSKRRMTKKHITNETHRRRDGIRFVGHKTFLKHTK